MLIINGNKSKLNFVILLSLAENSSPKWHLRSSLLGKDCCGMKKKGQTDAHGLDIKGPMFL